MSPRKRSANAPLRMALAVILAALACTLHGRPARAAVWEAVGGWEGDTHNQGYGFLTTGPLLPTGSGLFVPVRVSASFLYYNFDSSGTRIAVDSPGISASSGLRFGPARATWDVLGGVEVRRERRTPDTPSLIATEQTTLGAVLMIDADLEWAKRCRSYLLLDYSGASSYWYGRGDLSYQLTNLDWSGPACYFVGGEAVREGNNESDSYGAGGFVERAFVKSGFSIGVHAGYQNSGSPGEVRTDAGYLGIGFYQRF